MLTMLKTTTQQSTSESYKWISFCYICCIVLDRLYKVIEPQLLYTRIYSWLQLHNYKWSGIFPLIHTSGLNQLRWSPPPPPPPPPPRPSREFLSAYSHPEAVDMNGIFQMQGGKNWFLPKEINANRFFWDSHWLEIWSNHFYPSMGPNGGSVAMDSVEYNKTESYPSLQSTSR